MTVYSPAMSSPLNRNGLATDDSLMGESHPVAGVVCMFGVFLRIVMSDPVLTFFHLDTPPNQVGGNFFVKIHPGAYFILMSFLILIFSSGKPLRQIVQTFNQFKIYGSMLGLYIILLIYWTIRSPVGEGMLIDTHMTVPIAAIVLSYTPRSYCRIGINFFVFITVVNSFIGIGESFTRTRIFTFDPTWVVLKEANFRASALLGHPLNNATFTCLGLLSCMAMDYKRVVKSICAIIYMASLVAFGGRAALILSFVSLVPIAIDAIREQAKTMNLIKMCFVIAAVLTVPVIIIAGMYMLLNSDMGERLMAFSSFNDSSASARVLVLHVFDHMSIDDVLFGVPSDRIEDIAWQVGLTLPLSDIENPWILMFMLLGAIMFCFWLPMTILFAWKLMKDKPFALKVTVMAYYITVSTSNSFGRKDSLYTIMTAVVICAARALELSAIKQQQEALLPPKQPLWAIARARVKK
jgi:hypothetical protein